MCNGAPCGGGRKLADLPFISGCLTRRIQTLGKTLNALRGCSAAQKASSRQVPA
jgi:hypothetical protein